MEECLKRTHRSGFLRTHRRHRLIRHILRRQDDSQAPGDQANPFRDNVVLITGASSGIGRALATAFANQGANLVLVARNETKLRALELPGEHLIAPADVTKPDEVQRAVDAAIKREESDKPRNPELENTGQFNVYGIPAISVPCGFTSGGLPVGLMIAGPRFSESSVLALASAYERATEWHARKPPLQPGMTVPVLAKTDEQDG